MRKRQFTLLKPSAKAYGGTLLKSRKGRSTPRPLDTKNTMHLVLRSTKAKAEWSFKRRSNEVKIQQIIGKFSSKYGINILSLANVGNHLHIHMKIGNRYAYRPFIRAITAAIAMAVTGASRWKPLKKSAKDKFWDYRPFTRVIMGYRDHLNVRDYVMINNFEGYGLSRSGARSLLSKVNWRAVRLWSG